MSTSVPDGYGEDLHPVSALSLSSHVALVQGSQGNLAMSKDVFGCRRDRSATGQWDAAGRAATRGRPPCRELSVPVASLPTLLLILLYL